MRARGSGPGCWLKRGVPLLHQPQFQGRMGQRTRKSGSARLSRWPLARLPETITDPPRRPGRAEAGSMSAAAKQAGHSFTATASTRCTAPGHAMKLGPDGLARHCLEAVDPDSPRASGRAISSLQARFRGSGGGAPAANRRHLAEKNWVLRPSSPDPLPVFSTVMPSISACRRWSSPHEGAVSAGDEVSLDLAAGRCQQYHHRRDYPVSPMPEHFENHDRGGRG